MPKIKCEKCGKEIQSLLMNCFNYDGTDSFYKFPIAGVFYNNIEIRVPTQWCGDDLSEEEQVDNIKCPECGEYPFENKNIITINRDIVIMQSKNEYYENNWIPVSEELPDEREPVEITWTPRYFEHMEDKRFTATAVIYKEQWYWWSRYVENVLRETGQREADVMDDHIIVLAWKPLPEPYKGENMK